MEPPVLHPYWMIQSSFLFTYSRLVTMDWSIVMASGMCPRAKVLRPALVLAKALRAALVLAKGLRAALVLAKALLRWSWRRPWRS